MIVMHDSSGKSGRDVRYANELNQIGIATFRVDSFLTRAKRGNSLSIFSSVADAYFALQLLSTHSQIDKTRIGIIGWSRGGGVAHMTAFEPIRKGFIQNELKFAVHIPFYRGCTFEIRMPMTNVSVRELIGDRDDYTGVAACVDDAKRQRDRGHDVEVILYPGPITALIEAFPRNTIQLDRCGTTVATSLRRTGRHLIRQRSDHGTICMQMKTGILALDMGSHKAETSKPPAGRWIL